MVGNKKNINLIGLDRLTNRSLIFFNQTKESLKLADSNPVIKKVTITKILPDKIILELTEDRPIAVLQADQGYIFLSELGKIISKRKETDNQLPQINFYQNLYYYQYQLGEIIDYQEVLGSLKFLKLISGLGLTVDTVDINGVHMVAFNLVNKKILFSLEKDYQAQAFQLESIIKQFKVQGKEFVSLDLRFDKPVIRF